MKQTDFSRHLTAFLTKYLPGTRGMSTNSIKAYRDTFTLLLRFFKDHMSVPAEKLTMESLTRTAVVEFLEWIENVKGCSKSTRNARLAAIRSFFSYVEYEDATYVGQAQQILSIPLKKTERKTVCYLTVDGIRLLLRQPDTGKASGRRDLALMALMYDTGARVQEIADLTVGDVRLIQPYTVRITGKGQKTRIVPLIEKQVCHLKRYMHEQGLDCPDKLGHPLFTNASHGKMTRGGITYILKKYVKMAKQENGKLIPDGISCHSLRHSKAMHLLQADVPLIYIRDLLGHESVVTTEIYAKTDSKKKRDVINKAFSEVVDNDTAPSWLSNDSIMDWLKSL